jgi:hypothetical protein
MKWVRGINIGGYTDWRLPTREELATLAKAAENKSATYFNAIGFSNTQAARYWSSTTYDGDTSSAWLIYMLGGNMSHDYKDGTKYYVWPVRSGK